MVKVLGKVSSQAKKESTTGMSAWFNTRTEDYIDERSRKSVDLTQVTLPTIDSKALTQANTLKLNRCTPK